MADGSRSEARAPDLPEPFALDPRDYADAIAQLREVPALSLPLLTEPERIRLEAEAQALGYRPAQPVVGQGERAVEQDFEVSLHFPRFPPDSPFSHFAADFERLTLAALALADPPATAEPFRINDLIVQRYPVGSRGITPHRDHLKYRVLVALVTLGGRARFQVCADRAGTDPVDIPAPEGGLLLMRAPGLYGMDDRPFHKLDRVESPRISLGLRWDARAD